MPGGDGNMSGVGSGFGRNDPRGKYPIGQIEDFLVDFKKGNVIENRETFSGGRGIACAGFINDKLRDDRLVVAEAGLPPSPRDFLFSRENEVI